MAKALNIPVDKNIFHLIATMREGVKYNFFSNLTNAAPFSFTEWAKFLHLSERTMLRYKTEKKRFDPLSSEKILEISMLYDLGIEIFDDKEKFNTWLETKNVALGNALPKDLLDSTFGISLLRDELNRIEHGVLA